jgi:hypothetical protein
VTEPVLAAGDPSEAPAPTLPFTPGTSRPLSDDDFSKWTARIERGRTKCKLFHPQMDRGLASYAKAKYDEPNDTDEVDSKIDYRHVESKKSQLYHRTPEAMLTPVDPQDQSIPYAQILPLRQKALNHEFGPKGANAKRALHKTLVETLAASGWMITKVGFEQVGLTDPMTGQTIPIWSRRFISAVSGKKLIVPEDFLDSSDYDSAAFLAIDGVMPVIAARRQGWAIPEGFEGTSQADEAVYKHTDLPAAPSEASLEYTEVWYRAHLFDPDVFHPDVYRCLILVKGLDKPAWHVDSPYQSLTPQGQLTDDSMVGNPIHVGTLRDLPDSAHVPADLIVVEPLSREIKKFRTSLVRNRRMRRPIAVVAERLGVPIIEKLTRNEGPVPVPDEYIDGAGQQKAVGIAQMGTEPRDNFTAQDYLERDYEQAVGMSANQAGQLNKSKRTATEIRTVQGNSSARAETEKDRIRDYVVALYRKYDAIYQRTATQQEVQKVLGVDGAALWMHWKALPGKYAYDIVPDSGRYVDIHEARSEWLQKYELLRRDDRVNTEELLTEGARLWNRDPAKFIAPAQDKTLEPPKMSVSVNLLDLNDPIAGRVYLDLAANGGVKHAADTIAMMKAVHEVGAALGQPPGMPVGANTQPEHGGAALKAERLNKHQEERTGKLQGSVQ